jgi:ABC-2 type transport system permease protein
MRCSPIRNSYGGRRHLAELKKWLATIRISWSRQLAYKLNFLLLVIGPTLVFFFVKYNLWRSIF